MARLENLSSVGLGTYRMTIHNKAHVQAFRLAVKYGCNLIDTSSNYYFGESENLIGKYIAENPRKDLFVVTKAGYVTRKEQQVIASLKKKNSEALRETALVNTTTHCIHPDFLTLQIRKSIRRLNRRSLDGFLIHNPEYYLKSALPTVSREIYYHRIRKAFELLEEMAEKKVITNYGVSSNTMSMDDSSASTNLKTLVAIAREVSGNNHFRLIQFPFNFFERPNGAESGETIFDLARENNLVTFGNRPLNCHTVDGFVRLAIYEPMTAAEHSQAEKSFGNFMEFVSRKLREHGVDDDPMEFEIIAHLSKTWKAIGNHSAVDALFANYLGPFLNNFYGDIAQKDFISKRMSERDRKIITTFNQWCKKYSTQTMSQKCGEVIETLKRNGQFPLNDKRKIPVIACEEYLKKGLDHVLAGMTRKEYVEELRDFF